MRFDGSCEGRIKSRHNSPSLILSILFRPTQRARTADADCWATEGQKSQYYDVILFLLSAAETVVSVGVGQVGRWMLNSLLPLSQASEALLKW